MLIALFINLMIIQVQPDEEIIREHLLLLTGQTEQEGETDNSLREWLIEKYLNPVSVHTAGISELMEVPFMTQAIAEGILSYRKENPLNRKEDLLHIEGVTEEYYALISLYISTDVLTGNVSAERKNLQAVIRDSNLKGNLITRYRRNVQLQEGFMRPDSSGGYLGGPAHLYQRIQLHAGQWSANYNHEKDPGEAVSYPLGMDFRSWHFSVQDAGLINRIVAGDFSLQYGQGLLFGGRGVTGKSPETAALMLRNERGIRPYASSSEYGYFRGFALSAGNKLQGDLFWSRRSLSASERGIDSTGRPLEGGLHRTLNEKSRKGILNEELTGIRLKAVQKRMQAGLTLYSLKYNRVVDFSGFSNVEGDTRYTMLSADIRAYFNKIAVFGEAALDQNQNPGFITGLLHSFSESGKLLLLYRQYSPLYYSPFGNAFGEAGQNQNESGLFISLTHRINRRLRVAIYADQYYFPSGSYYSRQPGGGTEYYVKLRMRPAARSELSIQLRQENKKRDRSVSGQVFTFAGERVAVQSSNLKRQIRLQWEQEKGGIRYRSRVELIYFRNAERKRSTGFLLYQDLRWQPAQKLRINSRISYFDTSGYEARVYQFENDMLYLMTNKALFGQGRRWYLLIKYTPSDFMDFWLKYAFTKHEHTDATGSGLNTIYSAQKNEIGVQMRIRF